MAGGMKEDGRGCAGDVHEGAYASCLASSCSVDRTMYSTADEEVGAERARRDKVYARTPEPYWPHVGGWKEKRAKQSRAEQKATFTVNGDCRKLGTEPVYDPSVQASRREFYCPEQGFGRLWEDYNLESRRLNWPRQKCFASLREQPAVFFS